MGAVLKLPDLFLLAVELSALVLSFWSNGAMAAGDPVKGQAIFAQCQACHSADKGVNKIGPSLYGIIGRPAGSIAGYDYSPAMQAAAKKGLIWTPENVGAYLQNPHKYLDDFDKDPGLVNKMPFFLTDEQQRDDVVAYLKSLPGGH